MNPNDKLRALATKLAERTNAVQTRIPAEGPILGWQGFHVDLDEIDDLTKRLRLGARGVFVEGSLPESEE